MIRAQDLALEVAGRRLLEEASFSLQPGDKAGLVGVNGAGKTSLLRVLAGEDDALSGEIARRGSLGYMPQDPRPAEEGDGTALAYVLSGRGLDRAAARLEKLRLDLERDPSERNVARYAEAEEGYRVQGGYAADAEVRRITAGLGLAADRVDLQLEVLSGGERRRVEMARVLFGRSDVLLLDEPTNHLDLEAKRWLMDFLRGHRGTVLVVSHDLELLDSAITRILHLDAGRLVEYRGTYTQYRKARASDEQRLKRTASRQQAEITRLKTLADVMRTQTAKRARTAHALDKRIERMRAMQVAPGARERKVKIRFPEPPHMGRVALRVEGLAKRYQGPPVFRKVSFEVERGERLLVMGFNGAGKTSLLRILAGEVTPDEGIYSFGHGVQPGYYAQEHEGLVPGRDLLSHMREVSEVPEPQLRALLGMFGLSGKKAMQDAGTLSGGEKTRLALAMLVAGRHNLLLLDEPTNNLDPPSRKAVAVALAQWPGSMVIVSHDPEFVASLEPGRVLLMPEGRLDYWEEELLDLVSMA
ncbi:MAG: ATP-binding cassette domain-containing protein [Candidatus Dormibacteraeota bacterium]|jgi:ATPase subunit of ABC transporter with duplicated ATPase domains|nr:ATP-binding cassette domain-containing protein [Candidatus Dormibacteraeota bacterium]